MPMEWEECIAFNITNCKGIEIRMSQCLRACLTDVRKSEMNCEFVDKRFGTMSQECLLPFSYFMCVACTAK